MFLGPLGSIGRIRDSETEGENEGFWDGGDKYKEMRGNIYPLVELL